MRKSEFADLLVTEGVYSTRTAAIAAIDAGKVRMQNVEFEDTAYVFPVLDAFVRLRVEANSIRHSEMVKKGWEPITAREAAHIPEALWGAILRNHNRGAEPELRIYVFAQGTTIRCSEHEAGAYKSLMPGEWVRDTRGLWLKAFRAEDRPAEGCVVFFNGEDEIVHRSLPDSEVYI